jgi:hypothetical protein
MHCLSGSQSMKHSGCSCNLLLNRAVRASITERSSVIPSRYGVIMRAQTWRATHFGRWLTRKV